MSRQASHDSAKVDGDLVSAMATADRLSALPDRALQRVLCFLDVRDAASTSVLSQRWRTLWRQADTLNLNTRSYRGVGYDGARVGKLLFGDAMEAVYAGGRCPVRKLSVRVDSFFQNDYLEHAMRTTPGMDALLAAPAVQSLEELCVVLVSEFCQTGDEYTLPVSSLPWRSLRVLNIKGCTLGPPGTAVFERLKTLKMVFCKTTPENLQEMIDAASNLSSLWLEHVSFKSDQLGVDWYTVKSKLRVLLHCPETLTYVTLMHCHSTDGLFLDAPNVRSLRYKGYLQHFPFNAMTPSSSPILLQQVDVSVCTRCYIRPSREVQPHAAFWESIGGFSHLRVLKLKVRDINDIAVHPHKEEKFLKLFPDLKFLEVKGSYEVDSCAASVAIANLLHCCPAMQELRLNFKLHGDPNAFPDRMIHQTDERRAQLDLEKSMKSLSMLKSKMSSSPCYNVHDDDMDLFALKGRSFPCLDSHLRIIRLEFELEGFNCFAEKITKFLLENALVLEEIEVWDGDQGVCNHIHRKLPVWRANSSKSRINIIVGDQNEGQNMWH